MQFEGWGNYKNRCEANLLGYVKVVFALPLRRTVIICLDTKLFFPL